MSLKRLLFISFLFISFQATSQELLLKSNILYGAYALTPNIGMEVALATHSSLDVGGGYNPWNLEGNNGNKKLVHWLAQLEYRYWPAGKFNGHFFGAHILGSQYNVSEHKLPLLFGKESADSRYEGMGAGVGLSYGYQFILGLRWNLELNIGVGYAYLKYDRYKCVTCGNKLEVGAKRHYFGPTRGGISIVYIIKRGGKK